MLGNDLIERFGKHLKARSERLIDRQLDDATCHVMRALTIGFNYAKSRLSRAGINPQNSCHSASPPMV